MQKLSKRSSLLAFMVLALGLVLGACGDNTATPVASTTAAATTAAAAATTAAGATTAAAATTAASSGANLDKVVIAQGVDPSTLDPQNHNETPAYNILNNIYETLVDFDRSGKLQPRLAESWKQVDDLTTEFKLRSGVKWQDGSDFTADDVKYTIDRYINAKTEPDPLKKIKRAGNLDFVTSATVVDPLTVRIATAKPTPLLLLRLASGEQIVSKKYATDKGFDYLGLNPMGTGPYKFVEWKKADHLDLTANTNWWGAAGGPKVKNIRFRPIPDAQVRITALQAGEVDLITNVAPEQMKQLQTDKTDVTAVPGVRVIFISLNTLDDSPAAPLKNPKVRQALNYAIDRDAIINNLLLGNGVKLSSPIPKSFFGFEDLPQYTYDVAKAKSLLAEAGYPNGFDLEFKVPSGRYLKDKEIGEAITDFWTKIGVKVKFTAEPWAVYQPNIDKRKQPPAFLLGWGNFSYDPDGTLYPQFYTGQLYSYYSNPTFNKLIDDERTTVDTNKRLEDFKQANKILNQDAPWIFLHQQYEIEGISKRIKWQARPDELLNAWEISPA
jgi:peptide/nickel transport system substrate-binding protein